MTPTPIDAAGGRSTPRRPRRRPLAVAGAIVAALFVLFVVRFVAQVHALRFRHAAGPAWAFPSRVYSDGVPLVSGRPLADGYLVEHLVARGYRRSVAPLPTPGTYGVTRGGYEIFLRGFLEARDPEGNGGPERVRVVLAAGRIARVERLGGLQGAPPPDLAHAPRLEPWLISLLYDRDRVRRTWVPLARMPLAVRRAVVASEDRRFYRHLGLDLKSNARAALANVRARGVRQGASTITQQLARGLFLNRKRTFGRKLGEAALAIGLETLLTKDQILEMYLNSVYWGQDGSDGIAGIAEAARAYFDAPAESLGIAEAALLAGLIPAPNAYSPFRDPAAALARRNLVLDAMVAAAVLDERTASRVKRQPLGVRRGPPPPERFPSFVDHARNALAARISQGAVERHGLAVFTTCDLVWQAAAEHALAEGLSAIDRGGRAPLEGAFVAIEPASGQVRAMVGGRAPRAGDFNRATQALRQPGSAIKPVVYAAALDPRRGPPRFDPASILPDVKRAFVTPEGPWSPRNDENDYHEQVTLAKALAKSLNVATANLVDRIGPADVARYAERFGLGPQKPVPSIGLGTGEVTLLALTTAYATFPNRGVRPAPTPIRAVVDGRGRSVWTPLADPVRVLPEATAALMTGLLEDVVTFGISNPLKKQYGFSLPVGAKTGTTNDYNDAWFVGFTPDLVAGVWTGFDQPQSLGGPAAQIALPLWARVMTRLLAGFPPTPFADADALEWAWIDPWTGGRATRGCPGPMRVPFLPGSAPRLACSRDHTADWEALFASRAADSLRATAADSSAAVDSARVGAP